MGNVDFPVKESAPVFDSGTNDMVSRNIMLLRLIFPFPYLRKSILPRRPVRTYECAVSAIGREKTQPNILLAFGNVSFSLSFLRARSGGKRIRERKK